MYDRCISSWMSTGSTRSPPAGGRTSVTLDPFSCCGERVSDVEESDVLRVSGDEAAPGLHVLSHEDAEELVRRCRVVQGYLQQDPVGRVHRRLPQLGRVHLAETLVARVRLVLGELLPRLEAGGDYPRPPPVGGRL